MSDRISLLDIVADAVAGRRSELWRNQRDLAKDAGISRATLIGLENGRQNITLGMLERIADALDCDVEVQLVPREKP